MVHAYDCAHPRVAITWLVKLMALLFVAIALAAGASSAHAQMQAAVGVYQPSRGTFFLDGNADQIADVAVAFGQAGDIPLVGDIMGQGVKQLIVFRGGTWYVDRGRDGTADAAVVFGMPGDTPLVGDMDGDGFDDFVLYRSGTWGVSSRGSGALSAVYTFGGQAGDIPLLADVNGDGSLDLVIYRNGTWLVTTTRGSTANLQFNFAGQPGDVPIVFDYDGDGVVDLAFYRAGAWWVNTTRGTSANAMFQFGKPGDYPLYYGRIGDSPRVAAARLLQQATFGPTDADIQQVQSMGAAAWVEAQLNAPGSQFTPYMWYPASRPSNTANPLCTFPAYFQFPYSSASPCNCSDGTGLNRCARDLYTNFQVQAEFFRRALTAPDQLRLRTAWALSQIQVTSNMQDPMAYPMRDYFQLLIDNAFGNFANLLLQVTTSPWMGNYLDMVNNAKADPTRGTIPNENYARELMQLFSIGLWELRTDGSQLLDALGNPIPTYDQNDIMELSRALTGWTYYPAPGQTPRWNSGVNYQTAMMPVEGTLNGIGTINYHDTGAKTVMGYTFPANTRAATEVSVVVQLMANHHNTGPFICKQLIQQLVTGNPSSAYVQRVVNVWNNNGSGVRGDLKAVVRAIVLDPEARAPRNPVRSHFGKLKEPVLYVTSTLRALGATSDGVFLRGATSTQAMGQNVFNSPTVFNYYTNGYVIPGSNLEGPPFEIYDATYYFARMNFIYNLIHNTTCDTGSATSPAVCGPAPDPTVIGATGTKIDWTVAKGYAHDPYSLVTYFDQNFLHGTMPQMTKNYIIKAVSSITLSVPATQQQRLDRARMAAYLTAILPTFQVEF